MTDRTHDPNVTSWVASANQPDADFPIQNLPLGVFRRRGSHEPRRIGMAIGDSVLDVQPCLATALRGIDAATADACRQPTLNALMALAPEQMSGLRAAVHDLLRADAPDAVRDAAAMHLLPMADVELFMPAVVGDYTDFFASRAHATHAGRLFRPDNPLPPHYAVVPLAYHGRASSVVVSGTGIARPAGQRRGADRQPAFGPTEALDYELEVGVFVRGGNGLGAPIPIEDAARHVFGMCLLNDWSARDIQFWESVPLGPFLGKSFATTISPWVVTRDALEPFRVAAAARHDGDPPLMKYLDSADDRLLGAFDIHLEAAIETPRMREAGEPAARMSHSNLCSLDWTFAQMIAHHTSNGCNLRPGDLLGSGTVSGEVPGSFGCLLESTRHGRERIALPNGETRAYLEDGDEIVLRAWCAAPGRVRIGFGECRGRVALLV